MAISVSFTGKSEYGLTPISSTQQITVPFMFELSYSNLASHTNYSTWLNLTPANSSGAPSWMPSWLKWLYGTGSSSAPSMNPLVTDVNSYTEAAEQAVAKALQDPTSANLDDLISNTTYGSSYGLGQQFLQALDSQFGDVMNNSEYLLSGVNPLESADVLKAQQDLQAKLTSSNWQVVYFQYVSFGTVEHDGDTYLDSGTILIAAIPKTNAVPITFSSPKGYNLGVGTVIEIVVILAAVALVAWMSTYLIVAIANLLEWLAKLPGGLPTFMLSIGEMAVIGIGALALLLLIAGGGKNKNKNTESEGS